MKRLARLIPIAALALAGPLTHAQDLRGAWTVCTRDLQLSETLIDRANERELTLINAYGIRSIVPMERVLFVVRSDGREQETPEETAGVLLPEANAVRLVTLVDGQTVRGSVLAHNNPDELALSLIAGSSVLGDARIPLDQVLGIRDQGTVPPASVDASVDDLVVMRNGDRVAGFLESLGPTVEVSGHGARLELDLARVERLTVANDPAPVAGMYLRFDDREVIRADGFDYAPRSPVRVRVDPSSLGLGRTGDPEWRFDTGTLEALWVDDPRQRVVALSEIEPTSVRAVGERAWAPSPSVIAQNAPHSALRSIDFQSPARVEYPLPEGAARFACTLEAPIEVWTDCVVRIIARRDGRDRQVFEQRLSAGTPSAAVNTLLPSGTHALVIEIDPGAHGPIQDRVLMHRPRLLVVD